MAFGRRLLELDEKEGGLHLSPLGPPRQLPATLQPTEPDGCGNSEANGSMKTAGVGVGGTSLGFRGTSSSGRGSSFKVVSGTIKAKKRMVDKVKS